MNHEISQKLHYLKQLISCLIVQNPEHEKNIAQHQRYIKKLYQMNLNQCQDIYIFSIYFQQENAVNILIMEKLNAFMRMLRERIIQFESEYTRTLVNLCLSIYSKLQNHNPETINSTEQEQVRCLFFKFTMDLLKILQDYKADIEYYKQIANMLVSLFKNFQEEFEIPFLEFAIILLQKPANFEPIQPSFDMSFLVCVQMALVTDTFPLQQIGVFRTIFIGIIQMMEKIGKETTHSKVIRLDGNIFMRVLQIHKVFEIILKKLDSMPVANRNALLTSERLFKNMVLLARRTRYPKILQQFIQVLMYYQHFEILFEYILVYGLQNYSIMMGFIDFGVLFQSENFIRFVLKTLLFKQKSEECQRKVSLFLKDPYGCCMLLDMLNYSLSRFQKTEAIKIIKEFSKFEFLSQVKCLLVLDSTIKQKITVFTSLICCFQQFNAERAEIQNILNQLPYSSNKISLQY